MSRRGGADRHRAREAAVQLLYQWEIGRLDDDGLTEAADFYWTVHPGPETRRELATALVQGTTAHVAEIDPLLRESADHWRLERMAVVDRLILRLAVYELLHTATPRAVVINEALELAKTFGGDQTPRFVNGVLDAVSRSVAARPDPSPPDVAGAPTSS